MTAFYDWIATPFGWILGVLYTLTDNYLLSLLIITVFVRLILVPSAVTQQKNSAKQMRLQAKVNKIKAKYAGVQGREAQQKIQEETQELYRREGFNASQMGCLPMALNLIVMMGLYGAIYSPLSKVLRLGDTVMEELKNVYAAAMNVDMSKQGTRYELNLLHEFANISDKFNPEIVTETIRDKITDLTDGLTIFGIDLTQIPKDDIKKLIVIPILAGVSALLTSLFMYLKQRKQNPEMAKNPATGCMTFMSPVISVVFAFTLPAGIGCYWIISNILSFIQTLALSAALKPDKIIALQMIDETVERRSREESIKKRVALMAANAEKQNNE
ncbi:MAG: YidC/Oxa1 family membrane protein insertase [Clostridia bacterium]|nr:YidC/Oxa1 family membrane protein insertase [Clostridia bacterium]